MQVALRETDNESAFDFIVLTTDTEFIALGWYPARFYWGNAVMYWITHESHILIGHYGGNRFSFRCNFITEIDRFFEY